ncbi:hypothetical protein U9M48_034329 [Paspalum notatum var. saurae]|uniref:F-box domain-containing protein n=1 Tax=Paspalum notatum var. saurae TaxID=547442 RepID=A0AAQ3U9S7_PASNO
MLDVTYERRPRGKPAGAAAAALQLERNAYANGRTAGSLTVLAPGAAPPPLPLLQLQLISFSSAVRGSKSLEPIQGPGPGPAAHFAKTFSHFPGFVDSPPLRERRQPPSVPIVSSPSAPAAGCNAGGMADPSRQPLLHDLDGTGCPKMSAVTGLPDDALVEILSRLPAKSLCRSKCVSKAWCHLIADRLRCRKLPHGLEGFFYGCVGVDSWYESCSDDDSEEDGEDDGDGEGSEDDGDGEGSEDGNATKWKPKTNRVHGHFINLSGRFVPLVDPLFSSLRKQPGIKNLILIDSCNGLLLFGHTWDSDFFYTSSYVVYNPATEHWVPVPSSRFTPFTLGGEDSDDDDARVGVSTYLIFDPAASTHFELIEFYKTSKAIVVHTYSSETKRWMKRRNEQRGEGGGWDFFRSIMFMESCTFFKKMLHFTVSPSSTGLHRIAAIDATGKVCRVIQWPKNHGLPFFVGQSKGLLHCLSVPGHTNNKSCQMTKLSIWVLEDYDAEEWNLKYTVNLSELFGKRSFRLGYDYNVIAIHPESNLLFFLQHQGSELISYDLDRRELCVLRSIRCHSGIIHPYVPYFSELPVLSKH